jgi:hypothetical protein
MMPLSELLEIVVPVVFLLGLISQYGSPLPGIDLPDYPKPVVPWPGDSESGKTIQNE